MNNELLNICENIKQNIKQNEIKGYSDLIFLIYQCSTDEENLHFCLQFISELIESNIIKEKSIITDYSNSIFCRNILSFLEDEAKAKERRK